MRVFGLALTACVVLSLSACSGKSDKKDDKGGAGKSNADKIIGKWEPATADPKSGGIVLEFTKDGKMLIAVTGLPKAMEGTYKVEGDKLTTTGKGPDGKEKTESGTIKTLTDTKLVIEKDGKADEFKRK